LRSVNGPVTFSDMVSNPAIVVPQLGDHTAEVLAQLSAGAYRGGRTRTDGGSAATGGRPGARPRRAPAPTDPGR
jgi:hypothetical protein